MPTLSGNEVDFGGQRALRCHMPNQSSECYDHTCDVASGTVHPRLLNSSLSKGICSIEFSVNMAWIWGKISKNISLNLGCFDLPLYLGWKYEMLSGQITIFHQTGFFSQGMFNNLYSHSQKTHHLSREPHLECPRRRCTWTPWVVSCNQKMSFKNSKTKVG